MNPIFDTRRYLIDFDPRRAPVMDADTLVIGAGVAGLRAAIAAAEHGRVLVVAKAAPEWTNTSWAQGGVAAAVGAGDTFDRHVEDTVAAGAGLCDEPVVRAVVETARRRLEELIAWGMRFDREDGGALALGLEGAHSLPRILHAGGDATGRELTRCLLARARSLEGITMVEGCFVVDLVSAPCAEAEAAPVVGAIVYDPSAGLRLIRSRATVVACGGAGMVYRETSNPCAATGDGVAMAYRAGAAVSDMAFVQFHPTTLDLPGAPRRLISEAVRGEGAHLVDEQGRRFMLETHELGELAPRDVVSRAIARRQRAGGRVFLDVRHVRGFAARFPGISSMLVGHGVDAARELIPVGPAAHFMIGGITTDLEGRTNAPGLFAAGEVASVGLHGANRLASNSLLEGLVLGEAAGRTAGACGGERAIGGGAAFAGACNSPRASDDGPAATIAEGLRGAMWQCAGIERTGAQLLEAREEIDAWAEVALRQAFAGPAGWEVQNLLLVSALVVRSALWRRESRGCHWRDDAPGPSDEFREHDEWSRGCGDGPRARALAGAGAGGGAGRAGKWSAKD